MTRAESGRTASLFGRVGGSVMSVTVNDMCGRIPRTACRTAHTSMAYGYLEQTVMTPDCCPCSQGISYRGVPSGSPAPNG